MEFKKKNILQLQKLELEELCNYYMELRQYNYENGISLKGIELRNKIHNILVQLIKIDRKLNNETLTVIQDKRIMTSNPKIYACTHIGGNDIQRTFEAIKEPAYLFLGDPKGIYRDISGLLLYLNGVICLETSNKNDRKIAKERAIELLNKGGNLLIYPEGAWNITDHLPVMKLYKGTASMALKTGADLIPVGIEQYGNDFYVSIGKNIITQNLEASVDDLNVMLRNAMATQKWNIFEYMGTYFRSDFSEEFMQYFPQSIVDKCEYGFTIEDVYKTRYNDPNEPSLEEVFSFQKRIIR